MSADTTEQDAKSETPIKTGQNKKGAQLGKSGPTRSKAHARKDGSVESSHI